MKSKIIKYAIGIALAALGLCLFFRKSGDGDEAVFQTLVREISNTSVASAAACAALALLAIWLRALRLRVMLPDAPPPRLPDDPSFDIASVRPTRHKRGLFAVITVSYMLNNLLPARLGEAARVLLLWKRNGFPATVCVGSLLLERALDILAYLSFLVLPALFSPKISAALLDANPIAMLVIWLSAAAFAALAGLFSLYALIPRIFRGAAARVHVFLPLKIRATAGKIGADIESSLDWLFSARKAAAVALFTWATAFCYVAMAWLLVADFRAFGPLEAMFVQAFAAFGSAIPLAPGSIGTLHAVMLSGFTMAGVEAGKARAVTVLYHALQYVTVTVAGLLLLPVLGMKLRDITGKGSRSTLK
jgi:uncharacterized protein (TIRG00374 family)